MQAVYRQRGDAIDYTPAANVAAGNVVILQDSEGNRFAAIAKTDIKAGELGALAVEGVFRFPSFSGNVQLWSPVSWDCEVQEVVLGDIIDINITPLGIAIGISDSGVDVKLMRGYVFPSV